MNTDFVNLTKENLSDEHLCCIIRSKKPHAGIDAKRQWLSDRLNEGHVFRKLNAKATVFIEYAPLETAWVPIWKIQCKMPPKTKRFYPLVPK